MTAFFIPALNFISVVLVLIFNFLATTGYINNTTVESVSTKYDSLLTPAGYAFSIWGLIYLGQIALVAFQMVQVYVKSKYQVNTGLWILLLNLANIMWLVAWLHEQIGLTVICMSILLLSLLCLVWRLDMERYDAPLRILLFVWWPVCAYLGWIMLAFGSNVTIYLKAMKLKWFQDFEIHLAVATILVLGVSYLLLLYFRNMRETALVGIWGLVALTYKDWDNFPVIAYASLVVSLVLLISVSIHAYKNRYYSPIYKYKRGEW